MTHLTSLSTIRYTGIAFHGAVPPCSGELDALRCIKPADHLTSLATIRYNTGAYPTGSPSLLPSAQRGAENSPLYKRVKQQ